MIDRIVADSRDVALNHTAGLSLPQQVMMTLFSLSEMMDVEKHYQKACKEIVNKRFWAMAEGLGLQSQLQENRNYDRYYGLIDFEFWARKNIGEEAVEYLKKNVHPLDLAFRLAEDHGIVLLNGGGFEAPDWSLRVSLANLPDEAYEDIARGVRAIARGYRDAYTASKKNNGLADGRGRRGISPNSLSDAWRVCRPFLLARHRVAGHSARSGCRVAPLGRRSVGIATAASFDCLCRTPGRERPVSARHHEPWCGHGPERAEFLSAGRISRSRVLVRSPRISCRRAGRAWLRRYGSRYAGARNSTASSFKRSESAAIRIFTTLD